MVFFKTDDEIELLRESNQIVSRTLAELAKLIKPGVTTLQLDKVAEEYIRSQGGVPGFLHYNGYPKSICTSVNSQVVHGIPSDYTLKEGDIISVDCGVYKNGFHGDSAYTFTVGEVVVETLELLKVTKESLLLGIEKARVGNRLGDISWTIQNHAETHGFSVVRDLVGHGVGKNLHEKPEVPNFGKRGSGMILKKGLTIAIEPMINAGKKEVIQGKDGWTITTRDNKPSAHFEHSIAIKDDKPDILSTFKFIEEVLDGKK
ncbi:MAG: type I methionyl aminopeptidase [Bacteroidetes bacterium RIFOXYA12_FULL_35_11]|nr:MAG: type I methionyl aminopeptidase [Bacteroidetes bacterium GWF2_35_48]OFY79578.1 MAG: type I methionyl aminopeptidase [Bacteroidetes bacterium RIFOXYA12_FULL_35_11]OFY93125.1 MAG: type I methionyl aminopeptidase [Bacteroidetes bacterium RIFOXYC12_FULL_35_7]OFY96090.1 MAG: type I methionyl aminopeptidase [Bacteroidetes bacterium RIFOXYB2_FULL_35_7]HBX50529.1 type I methionyl aminopeptidase [Bacteroidales bacterium]